MIIEKRFLISMESEDNKVKIICIYCEMEFSLEPFSNYSVICPCCKRHVFLESEYGYGPVTPCRIYLGGEIAGIVKTEGNNYFLEINDERIALKKTYLDAVTEAEQMVKKLLGIHRKSQKIDIATKGGSLSFYGDWFGRPYDNYHKFVYATCDEELLEIIFEDGERLLVYRPENIVSARKTLEIERAEKIKWIYYPYGRRERNIITYKLEDKKVCKFSKYGTEYFSLKDSNVAVYLG